MIISPSRKFVFIHLQKCGGTSVERAYEKIALHDDLVLGSTEIGEKINKEYRQKYGIHKHCAVQEVVNYLTEDAYMEMDVFALVRNPFRLYESLYGFIEKSCLKFAALQSVSLMQLKEDISLGHVRRPFMQWEAVDAYVQSNTFSDFMEYYLLKEKLPFVSQAQRLKLDDEKLAVKHVYKLEEMEKLWCKIEDLFGVELKRMHENKSTRSEYNWNNRQIELVSHFHNRDLEIFDYQFDSGL